MLCISIRFASHSNMEQYSIVADEALNINIFVIEMLHFKAKNLF